MTNKHSFIDDTSNEEVMNYQKGQDEPPGADLHGIWTKVIFHISCRVNLSFPGSVWVYKKKNPNVFQTVFGPVRVQ